MQRYAQSRKLADAKRLLESGDSPGAARSLAAITEAGNFAGITDEALFLRALLNLRPAPEHDANHQSLLLLKRLGKEYPASPWAAQSRHLLDLLAGVEEMRRQVRNLKSQNQSLNNEVNELNRNIDRMKRLDQELEKKRR